MRITLLLFISTISISVAGQKNKVVIDSLEKLSSRSNDSSLVKIYNDLTWEYRLVNRDKAIDYGNKAISLGTSTKFPKGVAQAYNDLGIIYYDLENYDTAIALYQKAIQIRRLLNDELGIAKLYNKIGIVYQKQALFDKALEQQLKALPIFEKFKNDIGISYSLNNIGILNQNLGRYNEAIKYQLRSIAIKEKIGDNMGLAGSYINLANIYLIEKKYNESELYYKKAIEITRGGNDKEYQSNALNNLGNQYIQTKEYNKAIPLINESFEIRKSLGDTKGMVSCLNNLGNIYMEKKMYDSSRHFLQQALTMGLAAVNCKPENNRAYKSLSDLYEREGNTPKALEMYKLYASTKDSLFTDDMSGKFAELETKYNTLEKERIIQQQQFAISQKNYLIAGISGLLLLGSLLVYSYYKRYKLQKAKEMQQAIFQQQNLATKAVLEAEEKERQRIAVDLHDGIGQMMSAAKMNLSAFEDNIHFETTEQKSKYEKIIGLIDESCKELRIVSHNMMPNALLKNGLSSAVKEFIEKIDSRVIRVNLHTEGLNERLDSNTEIVLYRVIQEAVNNVIKHAGANVLDISLIKDADGIDATIEDNGKGFDTKQLKQFKGIGLANIAKRIEYLKGNLDFSSSPGKGTLVAIHIPLPSTQTA